MKKRLNFKKPLITLGTIGFISFSVVSTISFFNNSSNVLIKKINVDNFIADPTDKNYYAQDRYVFEPDFSKPTFDFQHGSDYLFQDPNNQNHIYNLSTEGDPNDGMENVEVSFTNGSINSIRAHNTPSTIFYKNAKPSGKNGFSYDQGSRLITIPQIILDHFPLFKKGYMKSPTNQFITRDYGTHMIFMKNWNDSSIVYGPTSYLSIPHNYHFTDFIGYKYAYKNNFYTYFLGARLGRGTTNLDNFQQGFGVTKVTTNFPSPFDQIFLNPANYSPTFTIGSNVNAKTLICKSTTQNEYKLLNINLDTTDPNMPILKNQEVLVKKSTESIYHTPKSSAFPKIVKIKNEDYFLSSDGIFKIKVNNDTKKWDLEQIYSGNIDPRAGFTKLGIYYVCQKQDGTNVVLDLTFHNVSTSQDNIIKSLMKLPKVNYSTHGWYNTTQIIDFKGTKEALLKWGNKLIVVHKKGQFRHIKALHDILWSDYFSNIYKEVQKIKGLVLEYSVDGTNWQPFTSTTTVPPNQKISARLNVDNVSGFFVKSRDYVRQHIGFFEVKDYEHNFDLEGKFIKYSKHTATLKLITNLPSIPNDRHYEFSIWDSTLTIKKTNWSNIDQVTIESSILQQTDKIRIRTIYNDRKWPILEIPVKTFGQVIPPIPTLADASKFKPTIQNHIMIGTNLPSVPHSTMEYQVSGVVEPTNNSGWTTKMPKNLQTGDVIWMRYKEEDHQNHPVFGILKGLHYVVTKDEVLAQIQVDASNFKPTVDVLNEQITGSNLKNVFGTKIVYTLLKMDGSTKTNVSFPLKVEDQDVLIAQYLPDNATIRTVVGKPIAEFPISLRQIIKVDASNPKPTFNAHGDLTSAGLHKYPGVKIEYAVQKKGLPARGNYSSTMPTSLVAGDTVYFKYSSAKPTLITIKGTIEGIYKVKQLIVVDASSFNPTIDLKQRIMTANNLPNVKQTHFEYALAGFNDEILKPYGLVLPSNLIDGYKILVKYVSDDPNNFELTGTSEASFVVTGIPKIKLDASWKHAYIHFNANGTLELNDFIKDQLTKFAIEYKVLDQNGKVVQDFSLTAPHHLEYGQYVVLKFVTDPHSIYAPDSHAISPKFSVNFFKEDNTKKNIILLGAVGGGLVGIGLLSFLIYLLLKRING